MKETGPLPATRIQYGCEPDAARRLATVRARGNCDPIRNRKYQEIKRNFTSALFQHQFEITRLVTSLAESGFKMFGRLIGYGSASLVTDQVPLVFFASMK